MFRRCSVAFALLLLLALLACAHAGKVPAPSPSPDPPSGPTLDQYGGRTDIACASGAKGYFYTQKVGTHWYFCDPLGNAFVAMAAANMVTNGNPTFDCTRQAGGTATSVSWSSGSATYTFPTPLPADAIVGNGLVTTGFSPSGYNVTDKSITAVNSSAGTVTIAVTNNPGAVTTEGTGAFDVDVYPIYAAKYSATGDTTGTTYNWGWQSLKRITSWNFNSVGEDSGAYVEPGTCGSCNWPGHTQPIPLPYLDEIKPAEYASVNKLGYLSEPIKDEITGTNSNYSTWRGAADYDVFDPKLSQETQDELNNSNNSPVRANNPYILGVLTEDSDYFFGSGAGPDFISGHTNANIGWTTLITSPVQTFVKSTVFGSESFLYQTSEVYTKMQATNPASCSISSPCSLRDYLWKEYGGSISALNTAWSSNYTSFDSTGTQVTGETIGTGDGTTTTFTYTLAHTPVSPFSVLIYVAGTAEIGDCPWFHTGCGGSSNTGALDSPTANYITSSTINYATGAISLTFATAPANGAGITANYIYGGWMAGGTGLMDENGSNSWAGTNPFCLEGANQSYSTYYSCTGGAAPYNPVPNANANLAIDLDNWVSEFSAQFFKTMKTDLRAVSNLPYLGLDVFGSWGVPAYSKFMQGAVPYLDAAYTNIKYWMPLPAPALFESAYQYTTQYFGDLPLLNFAGIYAQSDSSESCNADAGDPNNLASQAVRGQQWYNFANYVLTQNGYNGDIQYIGVVWWSWQDFQLLNQGLVSLHDNAYDGVEDTASSASCDSSYTSSANCGGEAATYGNAITENNGVAAANLIWLGVAAPSRPTAISKRAVILGAAKLRRQPFALPRSLQGREPAIHVRP